MRVLMLAGLLLGATGAQAQIVDWVSVVTSEGPRGTILAEARCFSFQGPALGEQCPGWDWVTTPGEANPPSWFLWEVERCTTAACTALNFRAPSRTPWRIVAPKITRPGLYRIRVYLPMSGYLAGEATFRRGRLGP